jgi:GR25 family glycosyltransferase involved in LPS biosynthesis
MIDNILYYYINLDHRTDRNQHMIHQFKQYDISKYQRIEADKCDGHASRGCTKSHINSLTAFIASGAEYGIIMEDDFKFCITPLRYRALLNQLFESAIDWNIVLLAANILKQKPFNNFLRYGLNVQTTAGYLVTKQYAPILLQTFQEAYDKKKIVDRYWKKLQKVENKFFIFLPKCGKQLAGYSDICKKKTNYGC